MSKRVLVTLTTSARPISLTRFFDAFLRTSVQEPEELMAQVLARVVELLVLGGANWRSATTLNYILTGNFTSGPIAAISIIGDGDDDIPF